MPRRSHKLHFRRFEFKYRISYALADRIRAHLKPFMTLDPYAELCKEKRYQVWSLYFDSPHLNFYHEKEEGLGIRKKIRFRFYEGVASWNSVFLEIKRKEMQCIVKDRIILTPAQYDLFGKNTYSNVFFKWCAKKNEKFAREFEKDCMLNNLEPTVLVLYEREPWVSEDYGFCRVTFDENIRTQRTDQLFGAAPGNFVPLLPSDELVMEIKFNESLPFFLGDIIQRYDLNYASFSKYCNSIKRCYADHAFARF